MQKKLLNENLPLKNGPISAKYEECNVENAFLIVLLLVTLQQIEVQQSTCNY